MVFHSVGASMIENESSLIALDGYHVL